MRRKIILTLLLIPLCAVNPAFGFDRGDVNIHGFVSQGYLRSSDNNYLGNSEDGTFEFNEIGISFSALLTDELRFGAQLFSRDLGAYSNNDLVVDWAFLDYAYQDWLGFRAGKIRVPFGFYNRKRDADMLRTSILMPQSVYNEGLRDLILAFYGVSLYGSVDLNAFGFFDYEFYVGTLDVPSGSEFISSYMSFLQYANPGLWGAFDGFTGGDYDAIDVVIDHIEGGMLAWNTPLSGLRFRVTDMMGEGKLGMGGLSTDLTIDQFSVFSAEYEVADLTFTAEYMMGEVNVTIPAEYIPLVAAIGIDPEIDPVKLEGYYGAISWDAFKWLTLGAAYGEYFPNADEKDGDDIKAFIPDYWAWRVWVTMTRLMRLNRTGSCMQSRQA